MNEILAVIIAVFDTERTNAEQNYGVFDPEFLLHDVYSAFDMILSKGIVKLY